MLSSYYLQKQSMFTGRFTVIIKIIIKVLLTRGSRHLHLKKVSLWRLFLHNFCKNNNTVTNFYFKLSNNQHRLSFTTREVFRHACFTPVSGAYPGNRRVYIYNSYGTFGLLYTILCNLVL